MAIPQADEIKGGVSWKQTNSLGIQNALHTRVLNLDLLHEVDDIESRWIYMIIDFLWQRDNYIDRFHFFAKSASSRRCPLPTLSMTTSA